MEAPREPFAFVGIDDRLLGIVLAWILRRDQHQAARQGGQEEARLVALRAAPEQDGQVKRGRSAVLEVPAAGRSLVVFRRRRDWCRRG